MLIQPRSFNNQTKAPFYFVRSSAPNELPLVPHASRTLTPRTTLLSQTPTVMSRSSIVDYSVLVQQFIQHLKQTVKTSPDWQIWCNRFPNTYTNNNKRTTNDLFVWTDVHYACVNQWVQLYTTSVYDHQTSSVYAWCLWLFWIWFPLRTAEHANCLYVVNPKTCACDIVTLRTIQCDEPLILTGHKPWEQLVGRRFPLPDYRPIDIRHLCNNVAYVRDYVRSMLLCRIDKVFMTIRAFYSDSQVRPETQTHDLQWLLLAVQACIRSCLVFDVDRPTVWVWQYIWRRLKQYQLSLNYTINKRQLLMSNVLHRKQTHIPSEHALSSFWQQINTLSASWLPIQHLLHLDSSPTHQTPIAS